MEHLRPIYAGNIECWEYAEDPITDQPDIGTVLCNLQGHIMN